MMTNVSQLFDINFVHSMPLSDKDFIRAKILNRSDLYQVMNHKQNN